MLRIFRNATFSFFCVALILIFFWWLKIFLSGQQTSDENYYFGVVYALVSLLGGINGLRISLKWGGFKSYIGLGILFLSLGLLGEAFGQLAWAYFNLVEKIDVPYPSIADLGYFSIIPFYFISMIYFSKVCGVKITLRALKGKVFAIVVPLVILVVSYYSFVKGQTLDLSDPVKTFFDLGYPLGEVIYVSLALVTLGLTTSVLGGSMKRKLIFVLIYFVLQYVTDYSFLYTSGAGTYYNGSFVDMFYAASLCMGAAAVALFDRSGREVESKI